MPDESQHPEQPKPMKTETTTTVTKKEEETPSTWMGLVKWIITKVFSQTGAVGGLLCLVLVGAYFLHTSDTERHEKIANKFTETLLNMQETDAKARRQDHNDAKAYDSEQRKKSNAILREQVQAAKDNTQVLKEVLKTLEKMGNKMP